MFIGRTDAKAETPILWPSHVKSWLIGKDCDAGRDWGWEEKGTTEDEMVGWHHWPDGHEFEWTPGVGDGQGGLASCDSWGHKESDTTEWLNWTELNKLMLKNKISNLQWLICYGLSACAAPKFVCWNMNPLCDGPLRSGLWVMTGINAFIEESQKAPPPFLPSEVTEKSWPSAKWHLTKHRVHWTSQTTEQWEINARCF